MPNYIKFAAPSLDREELGGEFPVATEQELLEFVNKAREAGGADVLQALLPSRPTDAEKCLIANGLNFGCQVTGFDNADEYAGKDGYRYVWAMHLPGNVSDSKASSIAEALDLEVLDVVGESGGPVVGPLPPHIGNAADAFDEGLAFRSFAIDHNDDPYEF